MDEEQPKTYEVSFLTKEEKGREEVLDLLEKRTSKILSDAQLTKLKLAYPIKKEQFGHFGSIYFSAKPKNLSGIRDSLKINPRILRFSIVRVEQTTREDEARKPFSRQTRRWSSLGEESKSQPSTEIPDKKEEIMAAHRERTETRRPAQEEFKGELSNEALEKKLEEILSE